MLRLIQGEKGKTEEKQELDPEHDQTLEYDELENAQRYRFEQLSFKQKLKAMRGQDVPQWADDTIKKVMNFHCQYQSYQERTSHLRSVSTEYID